MRLVECDLTNIITIYDQNHTTFLIPSFKQHQELFILPEYFIHFEICPKFKKSITMDNNKNETNKSRRSFFTSFLNSKKEKVKMLTADGKLVEVDKAVLDAASKQKVNNKEILQWMNNPSKNDNEI